MGPTSASRSPQQKFIQKLPGFNPMEQLINYKKCFD